MMLNKRGIITIAVGKKYVNQAKYLARSCMLNSPHTIRAAITDLPDLLSDYYDIIIPWNCDEDPFSIKTRLYEFSPFNNTLFLDADSLVFNSVDPYFKFLESNHYVYHGNKTNDGQWYFDIKKTCQTINTSWIPIINSGMFLFDKSETAKNIFDTAYYYFTNHKKEGIDIPFFRGTYYPDEPSIAISLAINKIEPVDDFGRFSRTLIDATSININVIKRIARFIKDGKFVYPHVVHFCGTFGRQFYFIEKLRMFFYFVSIFPGLYGNLLVFLRKLFKKK